MNLAAHRAPDHAANHRAEGNPPASIVLLLFAAARVAAGTSREALRAATVGEVLDRARASYGERFAAVLEASRVWVNGEPARPERVLRDGDEVAVLPPVSGGAG